MIVEQIWTANSLRNFNYLVACGETGEAMAIDPLDSQRCLKQARKRGWQITQILNTHEHPDHTGGNKKLIADTGATLLAHHDATARIPNVDRRLHAGDTVKVGKTLEFECLDTPGHTMSHICLLSRTDPRALFSGDTLFNAGIGNCHNGGHPETLFDTFDEQLFGLDDSTQIYPGHDYLVNNLQFTLNREPDNVAAKEMLDDLHDHDPDNAPVLTIGIERDVNVFFRLEEKTVVDRLRELFSSLGESPSRRTVFLKLRELRNAW